jgi:hypothetical protein
MRLELLKDWAVLPRNEPLNDSYPRSLAAIMEPLLQALIAECLSLRQQLIQQLQRRLARYLRSPQRDAVGWSL